MRIASILSTLAAVAAVVVAPAALAQQGADAKAQAQPKAAAKPATKADAKATKSDGPTAVRTTPVDGKKSADKNYEGCGHGKMAASDA